ncbi:MAG: hypothetical protein ABIN90_12850 [Knoellia sp.]
MGLVPGPGRATLGIEPERHGDRLDQRRLPRAVVTHEDRAGAQVKPVAQHLSDCRDRDRPDLGTGRNGIRALFDATHGTRLHPPLLPRIHIAQTSA